MKTNCDAMKYTHKVLPILLEYSMQHARKIEGMYPTNLTEFGERTRKRVRKKDAFLSDH